MSAEPTVVAEEKVEEKAESKSKDNNSMNKKQANSCSKNNRKRKFEEMDNDKTIESMNELSICNEPPTKKQKKSKNKDKNTKTKKKKRGWSEEEERLYREGLELYGRDWKLLASHVGNNRNAASIRSHSQVYFLKLLSQNKLLPNKVLESGNGYTLGGNPLNKYSSIAIRHFGSADNVPMLDGVVSDQEAAEKNKRPTKIKGNDNKKKQKGKKKRKRKKNDYDEDDDLFTYNNMSTTTTTTTIKRRTTRKRNKKTTRIGLHESDPYGLRTDIENYLEYTGDKQPFNIIYSRSALLIADIHSHLCRSVEIMGLLGGKYERDTNTLYILKCYPVREEEQYEQTVSADPTNHFEITQEIRNKDKLELIGWYHSHPCFENYPSNTDCFQHYQHKYDDESISPYIGLIISSWSTNDIINGKSHFRFFNCIKEFNDNYIPLQLDINKTIISQNDNKLKLLFKQIENLINRYSQNKYDIFRTDFGEIWDRNTKLNRGQKLLQSIKYHLMIDDNDGLNEQEINQFVERIENLFLEKSEIWWLTNKPQQQPVTDSNSDNCVEKENKNILN
mmetsp:Transcript_57481/g.51773  ORF Transcript_57481/g.51773 Transcript_57481/m.51773 type:complete len:561 (-) Transcript_57481:56-1738(-)